MSDSRPGIMGFEFRLGPEVPRPTAPRPQRATPDDVKWRALWSRDIKSVIRYHDAWGLMVIQPNGDVVLRDALGFSVWDATRLAYSIHLLLAKEVRDDRQ